MRATDFFAYGFTDVIPVTPPGATLAPSSKLAQASLGKVPGRRLDNGLWVGLNWRAYTATQESVVEWQRHGANTGLRADRFPGLDIDCTDAALAEIIEGFALAKLGRAPIRTGRAPKRLLMFQTAEPFGRMRMWITKDGQEHLVEVLGAGNQYVVAGVHPKTMLPYSWNVPMFGAADLPRVDRAKMETFFAELQTVLEMIHGLHVKREGDGRVVERAAATDQTDLRAPSLDVLREAVALIPNNFATREEYIKFGYAVRAACGEDSEDGFDIFAEWCERWDGGVNDADMIRTDWQRLKPPYSIGWSWIAELARPFGFVDALEAVLDGPPAPEDVAIAAAAYSDQDLADVVVRECASEMRYLPEQGRFIVWDASRWQPDAELLAEDLVKKVLRRVADKLNRMGATPAEKAKFSALAFGVCSSGRASAVLNFVKSERAIALSVKALDRDPWLLATPGGYVDLQSGELSAADPDKLCSKLTTVTPARGPMPHFDRFIAEVTGGDAELRRYVQKLGGYALTGSTREQCVSFFYGPGGNGKGVLLTAWLNILGDYATQAAMSTFTASHGERHSTDVAGLIGARLVISSETQAGQRWDEAKVKSLSGGDKISARFMRQDNVVFTPQFKLVFAGNHRPEVRDLDDAMRRRLHLVPFKYKPAVVDRALAEKLADEYPAILQWMIDGALLWQSEGLTPLPASIVAENATYFSDNSPVARWLGECTEHEVGATANAQALYNSWREWAGAEGEYEGSSRRLAEALAHEGIMKARKSAGVVYLDVKLTEGRFPSV